MLPKRTDKCEGYPINHCAAASELDWHRGDKAKIQHAIMEAANRRLTIIAVGFDDTKDDPRDQRVAVEVIGASMALTAMQSELGIHLNNLGITQDEIDVLPPNVDDLFGPLGDMEGLDITEQAVAQSVLRIWTNLWGNDEARQELRNQQYPHGVKMIAQTLGFSGITYGARRIAKDINLDLDLLTSTYLETQPLQTHVAAAVDALGMPGTKAAVLKRATSMLAMQGTPPETNSPIGVELIAMAIAMDVTESRSAALLERLGMSLGELRNHAADSQVSYC